MNHIEAHIESFHRIVQVDLAVFTFTFLCSQAFAAKLACAKDGWSSPNCSCMGGTRAGGVVSHQGEVPRIAHVNVVFARFARFARFASTVSSKTSLGNLPYFSLRTNYCNYA